MKNLLLVAAGGAIGSVFRILLQKAVLLVAITTFPWGTFLVNLTGCFAIGLFWGLKKINTLTEPVATFLIIGVCGGFTTFSTFSLESLELLSESRYGTFLMYSAGSVIFGLLATYAGLLLTK